MPFYSRHSNDGRDRFLGSLYGDDDVYENCLDMLFEMKFEDEIQSHYESSDADVIPPLSDEEEIDKIEKARTYQKEYHSKYYKEKLQKPYTCHICGKTLADSSNIRRHENTKKCRRIRETKQQD